MLIWKCEKCSWQSEKTGAGGSTEAMRHSRTAKRQDGTKHSCFLFDTDAQKPVLDTEDKVIKSLAKAQSLGIIPVAGKAKKEGKGTSLETQTTGVSEKGFTASGMPTDTKVPQWLTIGTFRMPFEDWGYSSALNLLLVAETYEVFKTRFGFDGKVGDFNACLCQIYRRLAGWDTIEAKIEYPSPDQLPPKMAMKEAKKLSDEANEIRG